jgi:hypothetical protein
MQQVICYVDMCPHLFEMDQEVKGLKLALFVGDLTINYWVEKNACTWILYYELGT